MKIAFYIIMFIFVFIIQLLIYLLIYLINEERKRKKELNHFLDNEITEKYDHSIFEYDKIHRKQRSIIIKLRIKLFFIRFKLMLVGEAK